MAEITIVSVTFSRAQSRVGYEISVIQDGRSVFHKDRIGTDPGLAAAEALVCKSRFGAQRIVGDEKVMAIVHDAENPS